VNDGIGSGRHGYDRYAAGLDRLQIVVRVVEHADVERHALRDPDPVARLVREQLLRLEVGVALGGDVDRERNRRRGDREREPQIGVEPRGNSYGA
jgi:hypothetical protein